MSGKIDSSATFAARSLGKLQNNTNFSIYGWGGETAIPRRELVTVLSPQLCHSNFPQVYCTIFNASSNGSTCSSKLGSPLSKDDLNIDGFLINEGFCSVNGTPYIMNYHSLEDYSDWIEKASEAQAGFITSTVLFVSATLVSMNIS